MTTPPDDLFDKLPSAGGETYDGSAIEVLEGLEPVRRRPGMYIGGTDERALHHLAAEVLDNAMDEAVAGHANRIEVTLEEGNRLTITDNGRGMPVDEHPKYPGKSALEVIMTMLHSGGKFSGKAYATSGGLHGVGVSVVNALSANTRVEVARNKELFAQEFSRGLPTGRAPAARQHAQPARYQRVASRPIPRFSARTRSSSPRACSASPDRRPISLPASRSAGSARPR
jgi:topoisomerase-4 subunit B